MGDDAITRFERAFARWLGVESAFAFWKGRVALYAILRAMGIGAGDEVLLPGYTCVMDVNPPKYLGAKPTYADIDPVTYNARPEEIQSKITPRTKVIVAQHTYGYPCEMDAIMDIAARHGIPVVEDCCLALGSKYKGRVLGTFGLAGYWSFQWNKPFTTGIGGMATTSDRDLAGRIETLCREEMCRPARGAAGMLAVQRAAHRLLIRPRTAAAGRLMYRWFGRRGLVVASSSRKEYVPAMPDDFFMGMSSGQARAGLKQMKRIEQNVSHRRRMGRTYDAMFREAGWHVPEIPSHMDPVLVRYPVRVADKARAAALAPRRMIELGSWFESPLHILPVPMEVYDYHPGMCPEGESAAREVVNLPTHPGVTERVARRCVDFVLEIGPAAGRVPAGAGRSAG